MINKKVLNYSLLVSGLATCLSGVMMQIGYHIGVADRAIVFYKQVWGLIYPQWQTLHQVTTTLFFVLSAIHVYRHRKCYVGVLRKHLFKRNQEVIIFSVLFLISALLGFLPWMISASEAHHSIRHLLIEIHDKISIVLIVFIVLHVKKRWKRMIQKK